MSYYHSDYLAQEQYNALHINTGQPAGEGHTPAPGARQMVKSQSAPGMTAFWQEGQHFAQHQPAYAGQGAREHYPPTPPAAHVSPTVYRHPTQYFPPSYPPPSEMNHSSYSLQSTQSSYYDDSTAHPSTYQSPAPTHTLSTAYNGSPDSPAQQYPTSSVRYYPPPPNEPPAMDMQWESAHSPSTHYGSVEAPQAPQPSAPPSGTYDAYDAWSGHRSSPVEPYSSPYTSPLAQPVHFRPTVASTASWIEPRCCPQPGLSALSPSRPTTGTLTSSPTSSFSGLSTSSSGTEIYSTPPSSQPTYLPSPDIACASYPTATLPPAATPVPAAAPTPASGSASGSDSTATPAPKQEGKQDKESPDAPKKEKLPRGVAGGRATAAKRKAEKDGLPPPEETAEKLAHKRRVAEQSKDFRVRKKNYTERLQNHINQFHAFVVSTFEKIADGGLPYDPALHDPKLFAKPAWIDEDQKPKKKQRRSKRALASSAAGPAASSLSSAPAPEDQQAQPRSLLTADPFELGSIGPLEEQERRLWEERMALREDLVRTQARAQVTLQNLHLHIGGTSGSG